jgi:hypothetical protein
MTNELIQAIDEMKPYAEAYIRTQSVKLAAPLTTKLATIHKELGWGTLNQNCGSCIATALKKLHKFTVDTQPATIEEVKAPRAVKEWASDLLPTPEQIKEVVGEKELTLTELRAKYPHIKSNSVKGFLKKLEDNG